MLVSFVLRVRPEMLAAGDLVGEVEEVESGVRYALRSSTELIGLCQRAVGAAGAAPPDGQRADTADPSAGRYGQDGR